jgi:hypothetical protein
MTSTFDVVEAANVEATEDPLMTMVTKAYGTEVGADPGTYNHFYHLDSNC